MSTMNQLQAQSKSTTRVFFGHLRTGLSVAALFCGLLPLFGPSVAANPNGADIFKNNCAACHANGENIVDPKKPVKGSKKLATRAIFKDLLSKPAGAMPAFPKIVEDDPSLSAIYEYCKSLK